MTISPVATTPTNPVTTFSQSSSSSIADIANQFSSLLANFSTAASPPGTSTAQSSFDTPASQSSSGPQSSSSTSSVAAYVFVSQTTTTSSAPMQSSQPPLFASIDASGNGLIDRQEFVNKFGGSSQDSATQLFSVMDKNSDNVIDGTELAPSQATAPAAGNAASSTDASWTPASLFQLLPGMQSGTVPNSPNLPVFARLDADQNGLLSPAEFGAAFGSNIGQATFSFGNVDANQNGSLDWSELNAAQLSASSSAAGPSATDFQSTTTRTTFFAELIQLQAQTSAGSSTTPAQSTSTDPGQSTTASANPGESPAEGSSVATTTAPTTTGSSSSTATVDITNSTTGTSTPAATNNSATNSTTPDAAPALADALTSGSGAPQADTSQTVASLQSGLLEALTPDISSTTPGATAAA